MSNGDIWSLPDGRKGLEVGRSGKHLILALMRTDWPFPEPPRPFLKARCRLEPSRYLQGQIPEDAPL